MTAKTFHGLENVLAKELIELGARNVTVGTRVVNFRGTKELMYRANLSLRTALSILKPIRSFKATTPEELYEGVRELQWGKYMSTNETFAISSTVSSDLFTHSQFVALKTKDAIADQFRDRYGKRPNVDTENPDLLINVYIHNDDVILSLDSSGPPLFKRGYRMETVPAPMNEVMAAGLLALSEWDAESPIFDPMCGSGTILTEALLMTQDLPSNVLRREYAFMKWKDYDQKMWQDTRAKALDLRLDTNIDIFGADIASKALSAFKTNLRALGLSNKVELHQQSFFDNKVNFTDGTLIMNPPYDERLEISNVEEFYEQIGTQLKHGFAGNQAFIFSGNVDAMKHVGLHSTKKFKLLNGALDSVFCQYDLYDGSKKA